MRVPVAWLKEYCDPGSSAEEIADTLTMSGLKLERLHRVGVGDPEQFVVGEVLSAEPHPDADRLTVCSVNVGDGTQTIVCGAPNVAAGQKVAVALPGAVMPDGSTLGKAKLRGVESHGMILAEDEVGIGEDHEGIMVLAEHAEVGVPLAEHLPIVDEVLELEITPNRPDAMGVYGVARDLHAATAAPLAPDPTDEDAEPFGDDRAEDHASVEIADPEICLRFTARVFEDVKIGPSPLWLKQRLMAGGQRPISNVVDITNYVMLTTAQPLHAFDLDRVRGRSIIVRRAGEGEKMTTLDGVERSFSSDMALVCDAEGPSGIAGIMGGEISEVSDSTTRVLMEAATWVGPNIMRTSKALGLRTEASARFEKQLHPEQAIAAQRLAARLMVELCGARMVPGTIDAYPQPAEPRVVSLRAERMERLLGERIEDETANGILERLGFERVEGGATSWLVPPWRDSDVQREADLIEEVARIHGLDKLPTTLPARKDAIGRLTPSQRLRRRLEDLLRDRGLLEAISYSFTSPEALQRLRLADAEVLRVKNPLSEDLSVMRPLILPGLLDAAQHNAAHGRVGVRLFESAHIYLPKGELGPLQEKGQTPAYERHHLSALLTEAAPGGWRSPSRPADFYAVKGLLDGLMEAAGVEWHAQDGGPPFLHPGRAASIFAGDGLEFGWLGELHPLVLREWDLDGPVAAFELDVDALLELAPEASTYSDVTSFPAVLQDIAVIVPEDVPAARLAEVVRAGGGELLVSLRVFDLYHGEQVGEGNKSLALRLEFRAPDRTLTDEEVAERRTAIERELESIRGRLRA
jgi:phenylalanyl-tRNA synthetase beta chain